MTLGETYNEMIIKANTNNLVRFIFQFEGEYFYVEWEKGMRWSDPVKIQML